MAGGDAVQPVVCCSRAMKRVTGGAESARMRRALPESFAREAADGWRSAGAIILREHGALLLGILAPVDSGALLSVLMLEASRNEQDPVVSAAYRALALKYEAAVDEVTRRPETLATAHRAVARVARNVCAQHPIPEYLRLMAPDKDVYASTVRACLSITPRCLPVTVRVAMRAYVGNLWQKSTGATVHGVAYMAHYMRATLLHGDIFERDVCWRLMYTHDLKSCNMMHIITIFLIHHYSAATKDPVIANAALSSCARMGGREVWLRKEVFESISRLVASSTPKAFWELDMPEQMLLAYVYCATGYKHRVREFAANTPQQGLPPHLQIKDVMLGGNLWLGLSTSQLDAMGTLIYAHYQRDPRTFDIMMREFEYECTEKSFRVVARVAMARDVDKTLILRYVGSMPEDVILRVLVDQRITNVPLRVTAAWAENNFAADDGFSLKTNTDTSIRLARYTRLFAFSDKAHVDMIKSKRGDVIRAYYEARIHDVRVQRWLRANPARIPESLRGADLSMDADVYVDLLCAGDGSALAHTTGVDVMRAVRCVTHGVAPRAARAALVAAVYRAAPECGCNVVDLVQELRATGCDAPPPLEGAWEDAARAAFTHENVYNISFLHNMPAVVDYLRRVVVLCKFETPWKSIMNRTSFFSMSCAEVYQIGSPCALLARIGGGDTSHSRDFANKVHVKNAVSYTLQYVEKYGHNEGDVCKELAERTPWGSTNQTLMNRLMWHARKTKHATLQITSMYLLYAPTVAFEERCYNANLGYLSFPYTESLEYMKWRVPKKLPPLNFPPNLFYNDDGCIAICTRMLVLCMLADLLSGGDSLPPTVQCLVPSDRDKAVMAFHRAASAWICRRDVHGLQVGPLPALRPGAASSTRLAWHAAARLRALLVARAMR